MIAIFLTAGRNMEAMDRRAYEKRHILALLEHSNLTPSIRPTPLEEANSG